MITVYLIKMTDEIGLSVLVEMQMVPFPVGIRTKNIPDMVSNRQGIIKISQILKKIVNYILYCHCSPLGDDEMRRLT